MVKPNKLEVWDEAKLKLQFPGRIIVNTEAKHYKFWSVCESSNGTYTIYWGRIGNKVQSLIVHSSTDKIETKIKNKIKKGYREI